MTKENSFRNVENFKIIDELEDEQEDRNPLYKAVIILLIFLGFCFLFYVFFFRREQNGIPLSSETPFPSVIQSDFGTMPEKQTLFVNKLQECS